MSNLGGWWEACKCIITNGEDIVGALHLQELVDCQCPGAAVLFWYLLEQIGDNWSALVTSGPDQGTVGDLLLSDGTVWMLCLCNQVICLNLGDRGREMKLDGRLLQCVSGVGRKPLLEHVRKRLAEPQPSEFALRRPGKEQTSSIPG